jgi:alpha-galactosidase
MNRTKCIFLIAACIIVSPALASDPPLDLSEIWRDQTGAFANAVLPGAGFSFRYHGELVGPVIPKEWRQSISSATGSGVDKITLTHPSGLVVTRETRLLTAFGALEYKVNFRNAGKKALPPISVIEAISLAFGKDVIDGTCVISSGGGMADGFLPPATFAIRSNCFAPIVPSKGTVALATQGGLSSNKDLPFFFMQNDARREGVFIAFGWSGQWDAAIEGDPTAGTLSVRGGIPDLDIALRPGEEIQGPSILVGLYKGSLVDGSNRLRRLIGEVYTPKLDGRRFLPVATYDHFWNVGDDFDESLLKKLADGAAAIHQEYFLLDAGWFQHQGSWDTTVGNWEQVEGSKFPNGLEPVADYVRAKGLGFGLWFEPERVTRGTQLAKEHPEWVLWKRENNPLPSWKAGPAAEEWSANNGVLDYGRPEVQRWVRNLLERYINKYRVKYIRYDFNIDPLPYWNAHDAPHRRGITQLRHIQGFYSVIDWIIKRHPDTVLEGCASGGRRIDLETARRFHTFWISDYTVDPSIIRYHLFGINYFLPGNYHDVAYTLPSPNQQNFQPGDLGFQSMFAGAFGTGGRVDLWPKAMQQQALRQVETWKKLRRYLVEDYFPLSDQPGDLKSWSGWQFQDPADHSGFVQTFRSYTPDETHRFLIHKLDEKARYRFTDAYSGEYFELLGVEAMTKGIEVTQEPMSSRVMTYKKLSE